MPRGRPPKKDKNKEVQKTDKRIDKRTTKEKYRCFYCGKEVVETSYCKSFGKFFDNIGRVPYCKQCIDDLYKYYFDKYTEEGYLNPEESAVKRVCMGLDIYYSDKNFETSMNTVKKNEIVTTPMSQYLRTIGLNQYKNKSYDDTILEEDKRNLTVDVPTNISDSRSVDEDTIRFFGAGFNDDDYKFLKEQYDDWVTRHECQTKAQEEIFKRICFKQLEILKATRKGEDTKNLDATFQNLLDTAKLQPKQNSGETVSDAQTFGTLIDKWENTRPIPEIDEELKDVDKIVWYIDTFYRGHLSKMMGLKNGLSNLYNKFMKKYTVNRPEYDCDENNEALFDAIFGGDVKDE